LNFAFWILNWSEATWRPQKNRIRIFFRSRYN
jgi:hypothetical protein